MGEDNSTRIYRRLQHDRPDLDRWAPCGSALRRQRRYVPRYDQRSRLVPQPVQAAHVSTVRLISFAPGRATFGNWSDFTAQHWTARPSGSRLSALEQQLAAETLRAIRAERTQAVVEEWLRRILTAVVEQFPA